MLKLYYFITYTAFGVFLPYLPLWLENRGITGAGLGAISALRPLTSILSPVIFGIVADRFGWRGSLISAACFAAALAMGVIAILGASPAGLTFGAMLILVGLFSFFRAPVVSIADVTAVEDKRKGYGAVRLWGSLGFLLTALFAGPLLDPSSPVVFPAVIALTMLLGGVVSLALPRSLVRPPTRAPGVTRKLLKSPDLRLFLLTILLWLASHSAYDVCLTLHLRDLGASGKTVGGAWALGTIAEIFIMAYGKRLLTRFTAPTLLTVGLGVMTLRWLGLACSPSVLLVMLQQPLHAFSFGLVWLAAIEYVRHRADHRAMATAQGSTAAAASLGSALSMPLWGWLYSTSRGVGVFYTAAILGGLALAAALRLKYVIGRIEKRDA